MRENEVAAAIVDAAFHVHVALGPGLLESVYETALEHELLKRGFQVQRQHPIPVVYDDIHMETGFRADLIVNNLVVVEVKAVELLPPVAKTILLTYLRFSDKKLGLLINFHEQLIKNGITRVVNNL
ncbi:MAG: GxxExxY protein [Chthonomonas sp.]|nr:GxxExxY protein [Chthonomonas sp.]